MKERLMKVFEVLADGAEGGPAGDGTRVYRFRTRTEAEAFAATATTYGRPAEAHMDEVPRRLMQRWGLA